MDGMDGRMRARICRIYAVRFALVISGEWTWWHGVSLAYSVESVVGREMGIKLWSGSMDGIKCVK